MRQGTRKLGSKFSFIDESGGEYLPWRACSTNRIEGINSCLLAIVAVIASYMFKRTQSATRMEDGLRLPSKLILHQTGRPNCPDLRRSAT